MASFAVRQDTAEVDALDEKASESFQSACSSSGQSGSAIAHDTLYEDIQDVRSALDLFLNSQIAECLDILVAKKNMSMYHCMAYACLLAGTSVLSFEREDIAKAIDAAKKANSIASKLRLNSWKRAIGPYSIKDIKNMTPVQRHAELVYAETGLLKAGLQILYDQSILLAVKEVVKTCFTHGIYTQLENYMLYVQKLAAAGENTSEYGLDGHLVSGISFGVSAFNLILSAVPEYVLKLSHLVGLRGDRTLGMWYCRTVGGWDAPKSENQASATEGLRRDLTDFVLMGYNIVLSKFTYLSHVDEALGGVILNHYLDKFPNGMIFLALRGRQYASCQNLDKAKEYYSKAADAQRLWPQLQHICYWEIATVALIEHDWRKANEMLRILMNESHWSKCTYNYLYGLTTYMMALDLYPPGEQRDELLNAATHSMKAVPHLKQRIAGKSVFMEKFVARKARKFCLQGNRLLFPDLEILFAIGALELMPTKWIVANMKRIHATLDRLATSRSIYAHDDIALSHLLRATLCRLLLEHDVLGGSVYKGAGMASSVEHHPCKRMHAESIQEVYKHAPSIQLDHWLFYFAKLEEAQLHIIEEQYAKAKVLLDDLLSYSEKRQFNVGKGERAKSKYSLESILVLKCHACLGFVAEVATRGSTVGAFGVASRKFQK